MDEKDEKLIDDLVGDILNDTPGTQEPGHLIRFWRNTPPEMCNQLFPEIPTRLKYLARYLLEADRDSAAKEQLFGLYEYLLEKGEDIPDILLYWVYRFPRYGSVRRRGRPEKTWRDHNVFQAFTILRHAGRSHARSLGTIEDKTGLDSESVRSIRRKIIKNSPLR